MSVIEKIRQTNMEVKIIVVSGHNDEDKLLKAIELNLISYQIKPINRDKLNGSLEKAIDTIKCIQPDNKHFLDENIYFDIEKNILINDNKTIELTTSQTKLLILFINNIDKTISSENLFYHLWDYDKKYSQTAVRTMMKKLRKVIPQDSILNVYSEGYKLKYTKW